MCRLCKSYRYAGNSKDRYPHSEQAARYEEIQEYLTSRNPERWVDDPDHISGTKKKNTRRWCKGKIGRKHVLVTTRPEGKDCHWVEWQVHGRPNDPYRWYACNHQIICEKCGKILKDSLAKECPDRIQ